MENAILAVHKGAQVSFFFLIFPTAATYFLAKLCVASSVKIHNSDNQRQSTAPGKPTSPISGEMCV